LPNPTEKPPVRELSSAPDVLFLFGLAGAGKNFVGDLLGARSERYVYHADVDITPAMREAIRTKQAFTDPIRDEFFQVLAGRIRQLKAKYGHLIVTQAAYKQKHRDFIVQMIPGLQFVHIIANDANILARLSSRGDLITPEYALLMRTHFENPPSTWPRLLNDGTAEDILRQAAALYPSIS
jgi:gluconokinase